MRRIFAILTLFTSCAFTTISPVNAQGNYRGGDLLDSETDMPSNNINAEISSLFGPPSCNQVFLIVLQQYLCKSQNFQVT
ncbi:hypothetical protein NCCP28_42990 [Niallia sp. NCCP-28]|nr:hypothetical protein NCCP28_42990 [Niallia sp. NCCP-28]